MKNLAKKLCNYIYMQLHSDCEVYADE